MKNLGPIPANIPVAQVDSTSTSTAYTATVPGIDALFDGVCVLLKNGVVTSESGFTININGLGAKPVYSNMAAATAETTIFNVNYTLLLVYDSTRVTGGCWINYRGYDSNTNTIGYQLRTNSASLPASDKGYRYRLWFTSADGTKWVPANKSSSTNATAARTPNTTPINPFGPIVYYSTKADTAAGTVLGASALWQQYTLTLGYSFNSSNADLTLTTNAPVYVKCSPQADGSATLQGITQTLPGAEDGYIYIFLGIAYSATAIELRAEHPVYYYKGGAIRQWTNAEAAPVTSVNNKTGAVTLTASDVGAGTYTKPSGGIPKTDLASGVQDSLDAADSAYQMPSSGIPASDLASDVIPSVPSAYDSDPAMDGTASPGNSASWARGNHVHPSDTSRQAKVVASGILKGDGNGGVSAATPGTDYQTPLTAGTDYVTPANYNPDTKTSAMTQSVGVDGNGKLWTAPGSKPTHIETILDYTFAADYTLSEAPNFSDYILSNGAKAVWNKDNNGNLLKAKQVWAALLVTENPSGSYSDYNRSGFSLSACCLDKGRDGRIIDSYSNTPSAWNYGDDIGNGAGTALLTASDLFNKGSISQSMSTCGFFNRENVTGYYNTIVNNWNWIAVNGLNPGIPPIIYTRIFNNQNETYKDYIYAVYLHDNQSTKPVPKGTRIRIVAEVYDA